MTKVPYDARRKSEALVHYLEPALEDMRQMKLPFEIYLLEMVVLALTQRDQAARVLRSVAEPVSA